MRACALATLLLLGLPGCGGGSTGDQLVAYREAIEHVLERDTASADAAEIPRLPRRRLRRIEVGEERIGPRDFLAIIGCPLSEVIAARNGPLGRVLEPTRRLAHELAVVSAARECLPGLGDDRAARLRTRMTRKRAELGAHVWNAVWLDEELERFLSATPGSFVGGVDPQDASWQLARMAQAVAPERAETVDVDRLEAALAELRDDDALGPVLHALARASRELDQVASLVAPKAATECDATMRRLAREFRERYLPAQPGLARVDRRALPILESLGSLYRATATWAEAPPAMARFGEGVLDVDAPDGLWSRYRAAMVRHAAAWNPLLQACGQLPKREV